MTATSLVILAVTLAPFASAASQQQTAPASEAPKPIILTGCVVPALDHEDMLQLVPAETDPSRPVGTAGPAPVWTVPAYLLLGGSLTSGVHANKTVEITGILDPVVEPVEPRRAGDTTSRTAAPPAPAPARLQVQSAKVIAATCTPRQPKK